MTQKNHALHSVVNFLADELQSLSSRKGKRLVGPTNQNQFLASISTIVRDAVQAFNPAQNNSWASIQKTSNYYSSNRYQNAHYGYKTHIKRSYEGLIALGYIKEVKKGVYTDYARLLTRYVATKKLISLFQSEDIETLPVLNLPRENTETIRLNLRQDDGSKRLIDYVDTPATISMRRDMETINSVLQRSWFDLELNEEEFGALKIRMLTGKSGKLEKDQEARVTDRSGDGILRLQDRSLYRVFNDTEFKTNGRLYGGWWQSIPKEYRPYILINGKRTVEMDYSGLHPNIVYVSQGYDLIGDPYDINLIGTTAITQGKLRAVIKRCFNAMLNAERDLQRPPEGVRPYEYGLKWNDIKIAILERHQSIKDSFFSGMGVRLQYIDSQVAINVLKHFALMNVPVLPIHDSFIMHSGYQSELEEVMERSIKSAIGRKVEIKLTERRIERQQYNVEDDDLDKLLSFPPYEKRYQNFLEANTRLRK